MTAMNETRSLQTHGRNSKVYIPILLRIFERKYKEGDIVVAFTLDEVRQAAVELNLSIGNPGDLMIYRMRSRTVLPKEILEKGFYLFRFPRHTIRPNRNSYRN
jgi:hypothetical protein